MMTFGSLFAGIGGFDLGLERAGMKCEWQCEIDTFCQQVLAKHWPDVERYNDVRECGKHNLKPVDLICGGFPCQPHSLAGKRRGAQDDRDLWPEYRRIIRELKPNWVLAENVPGILSSDNGQYFGNILGDLAASGYDAEWQVLPAAAFGAPHERNRLFLVAYSSEIRRDRLQVFQRSPKEIHSQSAAHGWVTTSVSTRRGVRPVPVPAIPGVDDGLSVKLDRIRALGNAVVPQVVEWIGKRILEIA